MPDKLHIDIETYSSVDIKTAGHYKYIESPDFEILILCYALNDGPVVRIDMAKTDEEQDCFYEYNEFCFYYEKPEVQKWAHNATFERNAFKRVGLERPIEEWYCSAIQSAYCGYPLSLGAVSEAMGLGDKAKLSTGKALIKYFSMPCKPTKVNGGRTRNMPEHDPEKWQQFIEYCAMDVEAEREITDRLKKYTYPEFERQMYILDQEINDRGIQIDTDMARTAVKIVKKNAEVLGGQIKEITGVDNPNSPAQLKEWLGAAMKKEIKSLAKGVIPKLIEEAESEAVKEVLTLRTKASKTSNKKYNAMLKCVGKDGRGRGFFQHYGANRTGRHAGRIVQLQNLPRNYINDLELAKEVYKTGDYELISLFFDNIPDVLSQLIRTAFIAKKDHVFNVADFSAIEARVIAWLANEKWRLDVFNSHGKIYEASASMMFGIPLEKITKDSEYRQKGKISELALGFQGSVGAVKQIPGGEDIGSDEEIKEIVNRWREKSPNIVKLWYALEKGAIQAFKTGKTITLKNFKNIQFKYDGHFLRMRLPSGRELFYVKPRLSTNKWGKESLKYQGMDQTTKKWGWVDTYGGKLAENCLAGNTKVLTLDGIKYITSVTHEDFLWDGFEWVQSKGVVSKGFKETITVNGVRMTEDHKILTENGWKDASQSEGLNRAEVQLPDGYSLCRLRREKFTMESPMHLWNRKGNSSFRVKETENKVVRVHEGEIDRGKQSDSRYVRPSCILGMEIDDRSMQTTYPSGMAQLRSPRNTSLREMEEVREFLEGYGTNVQKGVDLRTQGCERQLPEEQLHVGHDENPGSKQEREYPYQHGMGLHNSSRGFGEVRNRKHHNPLPDQAGVEGRRFTRKAGFHEPVYDILNSGPRHRFTVIDEDGKPFIVHNCVQAIARDLLMLSMLRLDKAGFNIVMHVHDEAVSEDPKGNAAEDLKRMERIMSEPVDWAEGLPIGADGYTTPFYKK